MNTGIMIFGKSQKMVTHPNMKPKGDEKPQGAFFGSLLIDFQRLSSMKIDKEVDTEDSKEKVIKMIGKLENMLLNLLEQGGRPDVEVADGKEIIQKVKETASDGLFFKMTSHLQEFEQRFIPEGPSFHLSAEKQELAMTFKELTSLVEEDMGKNESSVLNLPSLPFTENEVSSDPDHDLTENNLHKSWQEMRKILQTISQIDSSAQGSHRTGKKMKELLQTFMQLVESIPNKEKGRGQSVMERVTKETSLQEKQVLDKLMLMFQKRMDVPKSYHQQTPVTGSDIVKWVKQALGEGGKQDAKLQPPQQQPLSNAFTIPMTKVEQHVIYMNQNQNQNQGDSSQKQLIHELDRIIQSSRMFTNPKGSMEILIKLKPGNLGDLTVKFAQINGEMAVKILVTSQAAREMLEGNKSQLRHMFSPQQVVIEKVEASTLQQQLHDQLDSRDHDHEQHQRHDHGGKQDQKEETEDEELSFHEILMNEKV